MSKKLPASSKVLVSFSAGLIAFSVVGGTCCHSLNGLARIAEETSTTDLSSLDRGNVDHLLLETRTRALRARTAVLAASILVFGLASLTWLALARDFRRRAKIEAALAQREATLRSFYHGGMVMMGVVEPGADDILLISGNAASARCMGTAPEAMAGRRCSALGVSSEEILFWSAKYAESARRGGPLQFEHSVPGPAGPRWFAATVCPILGAPGPQRFAYVALDVTERRQAEDAQRRGEERLQLALESTHDGLWDWDLALGACYFSPRWHAMFGYEPAANDHGDGPTAHFSAWESRVHPDDADAFRERLDTHLEGRTDFFEHEHRVGDGVAEWRWVLCRGRVVERNASGGPRRMVGTAIDVGDRKADEERHRILFEHSTDAHLLFDDTSIVDCNSAAVAMLQCKDKAEVLRLHPAALMLEFQPGGQPALESSPRFDAPSCPLGNHRFDWVNRRDNGEEFTWEVTLNPVVVNGRAAQLVIWHDVTERKRAEEVVRASEERYRFFTESIPQLVWACDGAGVALDFNERWTEYTGLSRAESVGAGWTQVIHPEDLPHTLARWNEVLAKGDPYHVEYRLRRAFDGTWRWQLVWARAMRDAGGAVLRWFGTCTDIHDQKMADVEMRRAKEAAEAANRTKSEFLANVSHEIRTPMNGILGMTELALDEEMVPHQRDRLRIVHDSATSLLSIINDLLDFSKIEAGRLELDPVPFDLHRELGNTARSLAERAHRKGLELVCRIAPDVPSSVVGDADRLRQVLVNLLGNAIKFTENGGVQLAVEVAGRTADAVHLAFAVRDTGVGIPEDKIEHIFRPFEQADTSTTRRFGGTGLGLTIASQLVGLMGGQIAVESQVGEGTTFRFTARCGAVNGAKAPTPSRRLEQLDVLVVEDSVFNRAILTEMLSSWLMRPTLAGNAVEALAAVDRAYSAGRVFTLAVIDEDLPGGDGRDLASRLRRERGFGGQVLLLRRAGVKHNADEMASVAVCVSKPFTPSELMAGLAQALRLSHSGGALEPGLLADAFAVPARRILLAEDNPINQKVALGVLQRQGHTVRVVNNGREAVAALNEEAFDLVLMDVQMPELDGLQATALIRQGEQGTVRHLPIVAMTARAMKGDEEECLRSGMDAYLSKPFQPAELAGVIARVTAMSKRSQAPAPPTARKMEPAPPRPMPARMADALPSVADTTKILEAVEGDGGLLRELVALFHEDVPLLLDEIRAALADGDASGVNRAAHKLAGAISNFHAERALRAARQLEEMARRGDLREARTVLTELDEAATQLHPVLDALVEQTLQAVATG